MRIINNVSKVYLTAKNQIGNAFTKLLAMGKCEQSVADPTIPSEYAPLQYLRSDGPQYIDTGIVPSNTFGYKVEIACNVVSGDVAKIGVRESSDTASRCWWGVNAGRSYVGWNNPFSSSVNDVEQDKFNTVEVNYLNSRQYKIDGTLVRDNLPTLASFSSSSTFVIFTTRSNGVVSTSSSKGSKIKRATFTLGSDVIMDLKPVKRLSDGVLGMYDVINNNFYPNTGYNPFYASPCVNREITCNNGKIGANLVNKTDWNVITNPDSIANQGIYINPNNSTWTAASDQGAGIVIPLVIGKRYSLCLDNTDGSITGSFIKLGQVEESTPPVGIATRVTNVQSVASIPASGYAYEFTAVKPYLAIQMSRAKVEDNTLMTVSSLSVVKMTGIQETIQDSDTNEAICDYLLKLNLYEDTQDVISGVISRKLGLKVFTGDEIFTVSNDTYSWQDSSIQTSSTDNDRTITCTHFLSTSTVPSSSTAGQAYVYKGTNGVISFDCYYMTFNNSVDNFKAWVKEQYSIGEPLIVIYPLASVVTENVNPQLLKERPLTITGSLNDLVVGGTPQTETSATVDYSTFSDLAFINSVNCTNTEWKNNTMYGAFENCSNLTRVTNIANTVTNMSNCFKNCTSLVNKVTIPNSVTDMSDCFSLCPNYRGNAMTIPNSVTNLSNCFLRNQIMKNIPVIPNSVVDMSDCFRETNINNVSSLPNSVTNMSNTFVGCHELKFFNASIPDSVTNMSNCFVDCMNLAEPNVDRLMSNNAVNLSGAFAGCTNLPYCPNLPNTAVNISEICMGCEQLVYIPDIPDSVLDMSGAFDSCPNIYQVNTIGNHVVSMTRSFALCTGLTYFNASIPNSVLYMAQTFGGCTNLTGDMIIPDQVEEMQSCFEQSKINSCTIPDSVINLAGAFLECRNLTSVTNVPDSTIDLSATFASCERLVNAPIIGESVTNMYSTFSSCSNLAGDIIIHSPNVANADSCFIFTGSRVKNVYIPFNSTTYNSFVNAGYDELGTRNGVYLKDITTL